MLVVVLIVGGIAILVPLLLAMLKGVGSEPVWKDAVEVDSPANAKNDDGGITEQDPLGADVALEQAKEKPTCAAHMAEQASGNDSPVRQTSAY